MRKLNDFCFLANQFSMPDREVFCLNYSTFSNSKNSDCGSVVVVGNAQKNPQKTEMTEYPRPI